MRRQRGQMRRVELRANLLAAAEDYKAIVNGREQRRHVAHARVAAALVLERPGQRAFDVVLQRLVAVKLMRKELENDPVALEELLPRGAGLRLAEPYQYHPHLHVR